MKYAWLVVFALAGCPRSSEKKPVEPPGRRDAGSAVAIAADAPAAVVLPPAPALPKIPAGLPPYDADLGDAASVTPERVVFGELLFADKRLSAGGDLACATCHDPAHGFAGSAQHPGAPLVDLGWVLSPMTRMESHSYEMMGTNVSAAVAKLAGDPLIAAHLARVPSGLPATPGMEAVIAISAYISTRYAGDAPWDRLEREATPPAELAAGYKLFMGKARCAQCHTPPLYSDGKLHLTAASTGARDRGHRTPTLRGAAARSAFFHDGSAPSLDAAITTHLAGGGELAAVTLSAAERAQLLAFVTALTGTTP